MNTVFRKLFKNMTCIGQTRNKDLIQSNIPTQPIILKMLKTNP